MYGEEAATQASLVSGPFRARPPAFITPADRDDLALLLRWSWEEGVPLIPRAGGTGMPGGNLGTHLIVNLTGMREVSEVTLLPPSRLRVGVNVVADEAGRRAGEAGCFLPFLPSSAPWCRIGGVVANNGAGARSFRHGAVSAWVEEVAGYFAWGEPFRVGPDLPIPDPFAQVRRKLTEETVADPLSDWPTLRKNASGYALDRFLRSENPAQLLAGSEGTLAVLTDVVLRMATNAPSRGLVLLPVDSSAALTEIALAAARLRTETCEFLGERLIRMAGLDGDPEVGELARGAYALVLLEVVGTEEEVTRGLEAVQALGQRSGPGIATRDPATMDRLWALRHAASPTIAREADRGRISTQFIEDCVVPPERLGAYLDGVDRVLDAHGLNAVIFGHAGDGNVHVNPLVDLNDPEWEARVRATLGEVTELVRGLGGTLTGEHGDGRLRAPLLDRVWSSPAIDAFRMVKETFDARGILNPGVILPTEGQDPLEGFFPRVRAFPRY